MTGFAGYFILICMEAKKSRGAIKKRTGSGKKPQSISEYIAASSKEAQAKLRQMRTVIRSAAPNATESLKWGVPAFSYHRILVTFAAFKQHIGFYPTPSVLRTFSKELSEYKTGKGSVQFPLNKKLPIGIIRKMTKFRVRESMKKDKRWM